jgi:hypothetical protein
MYDDDDADEFSDGVQDLASEGDEGPSPESDRGGEGRV